MNRLVDGVYVEVSPDENAELIARELVESASRERVILMSYMQDFRDLRRELLNVLAGIAIAENMLDEFRVARDALLAIPQIPAVANAATAAQARAACKAAYASVVAVSPPQFINAFRELTQ